MKVTLLALLSAGLLGAGVLPAAESKQTGVPADYPLKNCPVSGEKLGSMGKPIKVSHDGTDVYLCCKSCNKDFKKDPETFTKMVKDATHHKKS